MRVGRQIRLIVTVALAVCSGVATVAVAVAEQRPTARGPLPRQMWPTDVLVSEVQERLYDINASITSIDGQLNAETLAAIRAWQVQLGFNPDGHLTDAQIALLRRSKPPARWAAIAYDTAGRVSIASDEPSRRDAEAAAIEHCRSRTSAECSVIAVAALQCAAAARATPARTYDPIEIHVARHAGLGSAEILALTSCARDAQSQGRCEIVAQVCPDGSYPVIQSPGAQRPLDRR